jgi:transposase
MAWRAVTKQQWELIRQHLPQRKRSRNSGRSPLDDRKCFEGILWILWTGTPWSALPARHSAKSAVHHRLPAWADSAALFNFGAFFSTRSLPSSRGAGTSASSMACSAAQKRGALVGQTKSGTGTQRMVLADGAGPSAQSTPGGGFPVGGHACRSDAGKCLSVDGQAETRAAKTADW